MTSTVTSTSQDSNSISPHGLYTISHFTNLTRFSRIQHIVGPEYVLLIMFRQIPLHNYCKNAFHLKWSRNRDSFSLLIYLFRLCWVFTAVQAFSLVSESREYSPAGVWTSHFGGFSCCRVCALGRLASVVVAPGLQSTGSMAQLLRGMWDLHASGIEPVSPAMADSLH